MNNVKSIKVLVKNDGTITIEKSDLLLRVRDTNTGNVRLWTWRDFIEFLNATYEPDSSVTLSKLLYLASGRKVRFKASVGGSTTDLLNLLRSALKSYMSDDAGDVFQSGLTSVNVCVHKTASTRSHAVMFA